MYELYKTFPTHRLRIQLDLRCIMQALYNIKTKSRRLKIYFTSIKCHWTKLIEQLRNIANAWKGFPKPIHQSDGHAKNLQEIINFHTDL